MIEHDYFGVIDPAADDAWFEQVEANDQQVDVYLAASFDVTEHQLDRAAALLIALEAIDLHAREAFVSQLSSTSSDASRFTSTIIQTLGDAELEDSFERSSGDYAIEILRSMAFETLRIHPEHDDEGESFATLQYVFRPEDTHITLQLTIDSEAQPVGSATASW